MRIQRKGLRWRVYVGVGDTTAGSEARRHGRLFGAEALQRLAALGWTAEAAVPT